MHGHFHLLSASVYFLSLLTAQIDTLLCWRMYVSGGFFIVQKAINTSTLQDKLTVWIQVLFCQTFTKNDTKASLARILKGPYVRVGGVGGSVQCQMCRTVKVGRQQVPDKELLKQWSEWQDTQSVLFSLESTYCATLIVNS